MLLWMKQTLGNHRFWLGFFSLVHSGNNRLFFFLFLSSVLCCTICVVVALFQQCSTINQSLLFFLIRNYICICSKSEGTKLVSGCSLLIIILILISSIPSRDNSLASIIHECANDCTSIIYHVIVCTSSIKSAMPIINHVC